MILTCARRLDNAHSTWTNQMWAENTPLSHAGCNVKLEAVFHWPNNNCPTLLVITKLEDPNQGLSYARTTHRLPEWSPTDPVEGFWNIKANDPQWLVHLQGFVQGHVGGQFVFFKTPLFFERNPSLSKPPSMLELPTAISYTFIRFGTSSSRNIAVARTSTFDLIWQSVLPFCLLIGGFNVCSPGIV